MSVIARLTDWTFRHQVQLRGWETAESFAARVAHANGFGSAKSFLRLMAIRRDDLHHGKSTAIERLAKHTAVSQDALGQYSCKPLGGRYSSFSDSPWPDRTISRLRRFCPLCIAQDLERPGNRVEDVVYARAFWNFSFMARCPVHGCGFEDLEREMSEDLGTHIRLKLHMMADWVAKAEPRLPNAFDAYLLERIEKGPVGIWVLDGLSPYEALVTCETVGNQLSPTKGVTNLSLEERDAVRARGYRALKAGPEGLRSFLDECVCVRRYDKCAPLETYSALYRFALQRLDVPRYCELVDAIADHGARNFPFASGDVFLRKVPTRLVHSIGTASATYDLEREVVRKIVSDKGLIMKGTESMSDRATLFPAEAADPLLNGASETIDTEQAAKILGVDSWTVYEIGCAFIITHARSLKHVKPGQSFSKKRINELADRLNRRVKPDLPREGLVGLLECQDAILVPFQQILRLLAHGTLVKVSRAPGVPGLRGILLSPSEILQAMEPVLRTEYANAALGTVHAMSELLISTGLLKTTVTFNVNLKRYERSPSPTTVVEFRKQYASLAEIASVNVNSTSHQVALMERAGIRPVCAVSDVVAFYRREEVVRAMASGALMNA